MAITCALSLNPRPVDAEVERVLRAFADELQALLGPSLTGLYAVGSIALGDYAPGSDIDFLGVLGHDPALWERDLRSFHRRFRRDGPHAAERVEGTYVGGGGTGSRRCLVTGREGVRLVPDGASAVVDRHMAREHGITLAGPPAPSVLDDVPGDELVGAARSLAREFWLPQLSHRDWWMPTAYQAFGVLTMCRIVYTVEVGGCASKARAAEYVRAAVGDRWGGLIDRMLEGRADHRRSDPEEAMRFVLIVCSWATGAGPDLLPLR
jgi:hypothetical protein